MPKEKKLLGEKDKECYKNIVHGAEKTSRGIMLSVSGCVMTDSIALKLVTWYNRNKAVSSYWCFKFAAF